MNKAYRFRIYPNKDQVVLLSKTFGCCRFLYNVMLSDKISEYQATGKMLKNTPAMYKKEHSFLKEVDSLALANVQLHLEKAYKNFFRNPSVGFPKYKSKHKSRDSYTTNVVSGNIVLEDGKLKLPKLGKVRIRQHREIPEGYRLKSVTVSRESSGKYYASLLYEYNCGENQATDCTYGTARILGIDYAMHGMTVFSDELDALYPGYLRQAEEKLAREQRRLSHCEKGSKNYKKQKRKVALCHEKVRNQRKDYIHKLTRKIADTQGKKLVKIDRFFPSSKKCCKCGSVKKELKLSERIYRCSCGNVMDRDKNAAINIREEARRMLSA